MEKLDRETQLFAVEKVLEEMQNAEKCLNGWQAGWYEQCLNAYCITLYNTAMSETESLESQYQDQYKLANVYHPETRAGEPLKIVTLKDRRGYEHEVEFGKVTWTGMKSKKAERSFSFNNNGVIEYSKTAKSSKQTKGYSYSARYNVLNNDLDLYVRFYDPNDNAVIFLRPDSAKNDGYSSLKVSIKDNKLTEKIETMEIIRDLKTGQVISKIDDQEYESFVSMLLIRKVEQKAKKIIGSIKGEIPLPSLVERLDNYLSIIGKDQILEKGNTLTKANKRTSQS